MNLRKIWKREGVALREKERERDRKRKRGRRRRMKDEESRGVPLIFFCGFSTGFTCSI